MEKYEKLLETLKNDEQFAKELFALDPAAASDKLAQKGFDFSEEELTKIAKDLETVKNQIGDDGNISEEDLAKVVGGADVPTSGYYYGFVGGLLGVLGTVCYFAAIPW